MTLNDDETTASIRVAQFADDIKLVRFALNREASSVQFYWDLVRRLSAIVDGDEAAWESYMSVDPGDLLARVRKLVEATRSQCTAAGPDGRRCKLAAGHPALPVPSWPGLAITNEGHMWEDR